MGINPAFAAPCGLYCGVCAVYLAHRDDNRKLKLPAASGRESSAERNLVYFRCARLPRRKQRGMRSLIRFKERLVEVYKGGIPGKGSLPENEALTVDHIRCRGCLSEDRFLYCEKCRIRDCTREKGYAGCHQCDAFPCGLVERFPMAVGKKVILRAVPHWRKVGTEQWIRDEEARYVCPDCGNKVFRGAARCNRCKAALDLD